MIRQHFKVILASVGLVGITWLCGCRTANHQCPPSQQCPEAAATTPEQNTVADNSHGREVAPPPPAEDRIPYDEPAPGDATADDSPFEPIPDKYMANDDEPLTPFPEEQKAKDDQPLMPVPDEKIAGDDQPLVPTPEPLVPTPEPLVPAPEPLAPAPEEGVATDGLPPMESSVATDDIQGDPESEMAAPAESGMEAIETGRNSLAALKRLGALVELNSDGDAVAVDLSVTKVADSDLEHLKHLTKIEQLNLRGTPVTDAGLVHVKTLSTLKLLDLGKTAVTDEGLVHLQEMSGLEYLLLGHTKITDAGLEHLQKLTNLKGLSLIKTGISAEGVKKLRQSLSNCQVVADIGRNEEATPAASDEQQREMHEKDTAASEDDEVSDREALPTICPATRTAYSRRAQLH